MTPPNRLVQAAAKEYARYTDERMTKRQVDGIAHALAAAFAALPECEEAVRVVAADLWWGRQGNVTPEAKRQAGRMLAALARDFEVPT